VHGVFTFEASTLSVQAALKGQLVLSDLWHTLLGMHGGKATPAQPPEPLHVSFPVQVFESSQAAAGPLNA
jgi:hypothetical protein